jgi:tetratricopeptide (TPR) repeat protein
MAMSDIQSRMEEKDEGFNEVEGLFIEFGKKFKANEYIEALKTSHEVEMKLNLYLSHHVADSIKDVEVHIPKLKDHGINVLEVTEALLDIKSLTSEQKYTQAYQKIMKVKEDLENATKDKATSLIVVIQEEVGHAKDKGHDVKKMDAQFKILGKKFGEKDFLSVIEIGQEIQKMISEEEMYQKVVVDLLVTKQKIQEADSLGCDISEAATLLQNARPLLESGNYQEALELSEKCREFTQGIIEKTQGIVTELKTKVEEKIAQIEQKFKEVRNTGIDITQADGMYEQTKKAYELGDYNQAFNIANECLDELEKESKLYSELSDAISQAKTKINEGKNSGLDVTKAEALFTQMSSALDAKDYETIKNLSQQIVEEIVRQEQEIKRQEFAKGDSKKIVLEEVGRAQSAIDDLKNQGIEPKKAVELFQQIVPEMQAGNLEKAIDLAGQSRESAESLLKLYKDFQGRLDEVGGIIKTTKESGIVLNEAEQIFDSIQAAIGEGDLIKARDLADRCVKEVDLTKKEVDDALKQMEEITTQLNDAMAYGLQPPNAPGLLQQAKEAFQRGDYKKAIQLTNDCAMDIVSVIPE